MYRKPRSSEGSGILNLDSLMDILSCLVGVMLFMVIYTVLELGSTAYQVEMPLVRDPPPGSEPLLVLATGGTVRVLDTDPPLRDLLGGFATVPATEAEEFVRQRNARAPTDAHFRYTLVFRDRQGPITRTGQIDLRVEEVQGALGDSARHLVGEGSTFASVLDRFDPLDTWLDFGVDGASLEAFRLARSMASDRGFATQWTPWASEFPLTYAISATGARSQRPRGTPFKPLR